MKSEILPLSSAAFEKTYAVLSAKLPKPQADKLEKLGLFCGATVKLQKIFWKKTFVFETDGAKIAVSKNIADKISVKEISPNEKFD